MSSNLPVLQQNTLLGLSESAGLLYLSLLDMFQGWSNASNERRAFWEANRYNECPGGVTDYIIEKYPGFQHIDLEVKTSVKSFLMKRWKHNYMEKSNDG